MYHSYANSIEPKWAEISVYKGRATAESHQYYAIEKTWTMKNYTSNYLGSSEDEI
jgi:hypothetical protein